MCHAQPTPERLSPQEKYRQICERSYEAFHPDTSLADFTQADLEAWWQTLPEPLRER